MTAYDIIKRPIITEQSMEDLDIKKYTFEAAKDAGSKQAPSDELAALWKLQRNAQFYWDFVMVENSEGAHNPDLTFETLDKAEAAADQALSMLG